MLVALTIRLAMLARWTLVLALLLVARTLLLVVATVPVALTLLLVVSLASMSSGGVDARDSTAQRLLRVLC